MSREKPLPKFLPIETSILNNRNVRKLNSEMPNCQGIGALFGLKLLLINEPNQKCYLDDIDNIAYDLRTSSQILMTVITSYNLFKIEEDEQGKKFFSPMLDKALEPYFLVCETNRKNALIGVQKKKLKQQKQLEALKDQLSDVDSSQQSFNNGEANVIECNIDNIPNSSISIKNTLSPSSSKESESFKQFKSKLIGNKISFQLPYPFSKFMKGTVIELKNNGYLLNKNISKDLTIDQANFVWNYMYENRNELYQMIEGR